VSPAQSYHSNSVAAADTNHIEKNINICKKEKLIYTNLIMLPIFDGPAHSS
jgi:hypothetical protein